MAKQAAIKIRGLRVHNLKDVDTDIPLRKFIVISGVSGSGKSSLAVDTLYAEGQRRYIETFSAYTRQFLEQLDKPEADLIASIPPAISITAKTGSKGSRSTVGTVTEINDYLRLMFAKIGKVICQQCGQAVQRDSAETISTWIQRLPESLRFMVGFPIEIPADTDLEQFTSKLREEGFLRIVTSHSVIDLSQEKLTQSDIQNSLFVIVDRLNTRGLRTDRLTDSIELSLERGNGTCSILIQTSEQIRTPPISELTTNTAPQVLKHHDTSWGTFLFSHRLRCDTCQIDYPPPEPQLFSFNSPLGACPRCSGFGDILDPDLDLIVPNPAKSIREGAIAPWNTPAYAHELEELTQLADECNIPLNTPFQDLSESHIKVIKEGSPKHDFGGLDGFFEWLERRKYKMHIRVFLSRWRSYRTCPDCHGSRLREISLCTRINDYHIADICSMKVRDAICFFEKLLLSQEEQTIASMMIEQIRGRLGYLNDVGLNYLTLDRMTRTLSGGEAQRVTLTAALGSSLVNTMYVLDEPSIGLHPKDTDQLINVLLNLRNRQNTVVVVEHDESIIRSADEIIDMGPGAGEAGGRIVVQGSPEKVCLNPQSVTGNFLTGTREIRIPEVRRPLENGWIRLSGARGNNLKNLKISFPLGVLCAVTGVSGSGKSTLIQDTLGPALLRRLQKSTKRPAPYDSILGEGQIDDVVFVDQSPVGRSTRSNPVTYVKAFDEIRRAFAATRQSRIRNIGAGKFSFNISGGRCEACKGNGYKTVDMQFLPDVHMVCQQCHGSRFGKEILEIRFRGKNVAEVLDLTIREAFLFYRGYPRIQEKLSRLIDVGLEYLRLGQATSTLSAGEAQRLKLAGWLSSTSRQRCLFLLDEPTTGLHSADIVQLLDTFHALLSAGHSLIVVEHNLHIIKSADYVIDLGPGAADQGGQLVASGTPEEISQLPTSITGKFLADLLK